MTYINAEESSYRELQWVLNYAMEGGQYEYIDDAEATDVNIFKIPKRLCGWLFMGARLYSSHRAQWNAAHDWWHEH